MEGASELLRELFGEAGTLATPATVAGNAVAPALPGRVGLKPFLDAA